MPKSTDERVATDLIESLVDARNGFEHAAQRLADADRQDMAARFATFAAQRREFSFELQSIAALHGDGIDQDGSIAAAMHRFWITAGSALSGSDVEGLLNASLTGEDHAVADYEDALDQHISADLRDAITRQLAAVKATRDEIRTLFDRVG